MRTLAAQVLTILILAGAAFTEESSTPLHAFVGRSLVLDSPHPLRRVAVTDPAIVSATVINPRQVLLNGLQPGAVTLLLWDEEEKVRTFELTVDRDLEPLRRAIRQALPREAIDVTQSRGSVLLSGQVSSKAVIDQAVAIAQAHAEKVVSLLGDSALQVSLKVRVAEVSRSAVNELGVTLFTTGLTLDDYGTGANIPDWDRIVLNDTNGPAWKGQDWHQASIRPELGAFQISGWFDEDLPGTLSNWSLMARIGTAPQRLLVGPWKLGYNRDRSLNGYSYGLDALRDDVWVLKQQWYDHFLKGVDNGVERTQVEYFVLGDNAWRRASAWPPAVVERQDWYFHRDGRANRRFTSGKLSREIPLGDEPPDRYRYDPTNPVPNWMSFEQMQRWEDVQTFQWDMKDIETRHDVVTYTSAVLESDLTIAGDVLAVVYASVDVKDTDWWVHISDVGRGWTFEPSHPRLAPGPVS